MIFRDIIGLIRPLKSSPVYLIFLKIGYTRMQELIGKNWNTHMTNEDFIVALLEFYELICYTSLERMSKDSHSYFYTVLNDTFQLLCFLRRKPAHIVKECNAHMQTLSYEALIKFFKRKHKLTSKFLGIANNILKNKNMNYGVFHYFNNKNFVGFLEQVLAFIFINIPILSVGVFGLKLVFSERKKHCGEHYEHV